MSTPNFYIKNASRYYVIGSNKYITQEYIDENGYDQDMLGKYDDDYTQVCYDDDKCNVQSDLEAKGFDKGDRLYGCAQIIASKYIYLDYAGMKIRLRFWVLLRPGYYEAACFDYDGEIEIYDRNGYCGGLYDMFGEFAPDEAEIRRANWTGYKGLSSLQAKNIANKIRSVIETLKNQAETAFSLYSEYELYRDYLLNNGEAGYSEVKTKFYEDHKSV